MKRKIILSLLIVAALSILSASFAILYVKNTTATLSQLITLHQIEDLRQHLVLSIQTVQSDLYSINTRLGSKLDLVVDDVDRLEQASQQCLSCHHTAEVERQIEEVRSLIGVYQKELSFFITASADTGHINLLKSESAAVGAKILAATAAMSEKASAKLERLTQDALQKSNRTWMILVVTILLTFIVGIIVAVKLTRAIIRPIETLVAATRAIAGGDLGYTTLYQDKTEFGELASHFNTMSTSLKDSYAELEQELRERKRMEEELRIKALFLDSAMDSIILHDLDGNFVYVNDAACVTRGYTRQELMNMNLKQLDVPEYAELIQPRIRELLEKGAGIFETAHYHKNGTILPIEVHSRVIESEGRKLILTAARDITERNRAQQALQASEAQFRVLFEQAGVGVVLAESQTGRFIKVNRRFCEIVGYSADELTTMTFRDITYPDDLESNLDLMRGLIAGELREFSMEKRYLHRSGRVIWAAITISPLWAPGDTPVNNIGVVQDITERKRIESELRESNLSFQQLFETAPIPTWEEDFTPVSKCLEDLRAQGVTNVREYLQSHSELVRKTFGRIPIVRANRSALKLYGAANESELLGSIDKFMLPETLSLFQELLIAIAEGKTSFRAETVVSTLDDRKIDVIFDLEVIGESGELNRTIVSHTDITTLKRVERLLRQSSNLISNVLNSISAEILIIDAHDRTILGCNSYFLHESGLREEEVIGQVCQVLMSKYNLPCQLLDKKCPFTETLETGRQAICEQILVDKSGQTRVFEISTFPVKDDEGRIYQIVHMSQDITLRKQVEVARLREEEVRRILAERRIVETQLRMLQAQIEPHFLFNTLAHIISLIDADPGNAKKMLRYLTELLRVSLQRTREEISTLGHEMDLLNDYLSIYAMRMGRRLRFEINVPEELRSLSFPPLLVQPLVENAVRHGIEPKIKGGSITIKAERIKGALLLSVIDTGQGFSDQAVAGGVGLENVRERLHALYGEKGRLELKQNDAGGVTATMEVPL